MLKRFSDTIGLIYAAATNSDLWRAALVAVEDLTASTGAVIDLIPASESVRPLTLAGSFSEDNCAEYACNYMAVCPRIRFGVSHLGRTQVDYMFISESEMDRDIVYNWYASHGLRYHIATINRISANYNGAFSVQRTPRQGHPQEKDIRLFELVKPHLSQSLALAEQLGTLRSFQQFSSAVLQSLPQALFALDKDGTILFANASAEAVLRQADGLWSSGGRLYARLPGEQAHLDAAVRGAAMMNAQCNGWVRITRANGGPSYAVFVSPLNCCDEELLAARAEILVTVHDTAERRVAEPQMLIEIYGLTHAEARLANALCGGHSIESAASLFAVQAATIRSQLKSVFRKMRVNRQQDLVRLLTNLSLNGDPRRPCS